MPKIALALGILTFVLPAAAHAAPIDINTATAAELDTLPGIGPSKAAAIIAYRESHGPFRATSDIQKVKGIGPATYANLAALIMVDTASLPAPQPAAVVHAVQTASVQVTPVRESLPAASSTAALREPMTPTPATGMVSSTWTLLFIGLVVVASGAMLII